MYAIVEIAGQQFKVEKNQQIFVHRLNSKEGGKVVFKNVLLVDDNEKIQIGTPYVKNTKVTAKVLKHLKGDKIIVFKKKRRKGHQKKNGHRQNFTLVQVDKISKKTATTATKKKTTKTTVTKKKTTKKSNSSSSTIRIVGDNLVIENLKIKNPQLVELLKKEKNKEKQTKLIEEIIDYGINLFNTLKGRVETDYAKNSFESIKGQLNDKLDSTLDSVQKEYDKYIE